MRAHAGRSILLVEDEETDVEQFLRLAKKHNLDAPIHCAEDGEEALDMLRRVERNNGVSATILVTDLNLPGLTGHELIDAVRKTPEIANSIIFVLSTSDLESDKKRAYENHVAGYIIKESDRVTEGIRMLRHFCSAVDI